MSKLTRQGARNLTAALDRIAQTLQSRHDLLGVEKKIATDFAYRCDLLSDAIERTAVSNFPISREAAEKGVDDEGLSVDHGESGFDANLIGDAVPGPLEIITPPDEKWMNGHFTQENFHELGELQEAGELGPVKLASILHNLSEATALLAKAAKKSQQKPEAQQAQKAQQKAKAQQAQEAQEQEAQEQEAQEQEAQQAPKAQQKAKAQQGKGEAQQAPKAQQSQKAKKAFDQSNDWGFNLSE
jgi:chemotaxis protein histidine kinase CheA